MTDMGTDDFQTPSEDSGSSSMAPRGVTPLQERAADLLAQACSPSQVANLVGRSREQLWRWRTQNTEFMKLLARFKAQYHLERVDRFFSMTDPAIDVVAESLREGDPVVAMQFLRLVAPSLTELRLVEAADVSPQAEPDEKEVDGDPIDGGDPSPPPTP